MSRQPIVLPNEVVFAEVEERIARGERVTIPLKGRSMEPLLREGCFVELSPVEGGVRKNDVVLIRYCGQHILHRVVHVSGDHITTQGDNSPVIEHVMADDVVARLSRVEDEHGEVSCDSDDWRRRSRRVLRKMRWRRLAHRCLGRKARRMLSPIYFVCLLLLMWGPVGALGIPLNNFIFHIRLDHLLHASVYIPCTWFLMDWLLSADTARRRYGWLWLAAIGVAVMTESVQYLLPYRGFDINDLVANFLGVTVGWVALLIVKRAAGNAMR
ncbi:MAG: VanZ family protein [Bacteroidales bacterium]|nr:VanZ family protein [Bacteroidales bacterium]